MAQQRKIDAWAVPLATLANVRARRVVLSVCGALRGSTLDPRARAKLTFA